MLARYFLSLCLFGLFAVVISGSPVEEPESQVAARIEPRNPGLAVAMGVLRKVFQKAAQHCLQEAALSCKQHWNSPKALRKCGRGFLKANKGRCVVG